MRSVRPTLRWMGWQYKSACASQDNCVCARGLTVPCCCPPALTAQPSGSPLCDHHRHSEQCHAQSTLWCCRGHPTLVSSVAWQQLKVCDPQNGRTACQHEGTMNYMQLHLHSPNAIMCNTRTTSHSTTCYSCRCHRLTRRRRELWRRANRGTLRRR
jgi:hypothetical protein